MFVSSLLAWMVFHYSLSAIACANILVVSPTSYYSHHAAFLEVWQALMVRGHNITMVTSFPETAPHNITVIDSSTNTIILDKMLTYEKLVATSKWFIWPLYMEGVPDAESTILSIPGLQDIVHNHTKYTFDVIIVEVWYTSIFALSKIFNCPYVVFSPLEIPDVMHWHLGNQLNHVDIPEMNFEIYQATNFFERLTSGLFTFIELCREHFVYLPQFQATLNEHFGKYTAVTSKELKEDVDLMLINVNPVLKSVGAVGRTTIFVGGGNHIAPSKPIPEDLKSYLDNAKEGFIYLSLGSIVQSKNLEGNMVNDLIDVISKLPYKILWKFEDDNLLNKPANVKIVKWTPQQDILRHPNIKLFISQGGIQSMEEALYSHVPMLIMPFYGDQHKNGQLATFRGFGKAIRHKPKLNKLELETTIHELINNPEYKKTAKRIATMMNDTYMTGLEKSVWWIEYVIRNNGTKELRNPAAKLPFYQYYALDIIGFLLVVTLILVYLMIVLSRFIFRVCQNILYSTQQKKKTL